MKLNAGLKLREMGAVKMIVDATASQANLTNVFSLNAVAADVWQYIGDKEFTIEQLIAYVCEEYDVDYEVAKRDMEALVDEWIGYGLVVNE